MLLYFCDRKLTTIFINQKYKDEKYYPITTLNH